jgi:hypothetical protein
MPKPKFLHQLQDAAPCTVGIARQLSVAAANKMYMQARKENAILYEAIKQLTAIVTDQQRQLDARWIVRLRHWLARRNRELHAPAGVVLPTQEEVLALHNSSDTEPQVPITEDATDGD